MKKKCCTCKKTKHVRAFNKHRDHKDGLSSHCRLCNKKSSRAYYYQDRDRARQKRREATYGITAEALQVLFISQNEVCALCERSLEGSRQFNVDHCHTTQIVRGILCNRCNRALGFFDDDPARMRKAANYVEKVYIENA